MKNSTSAENLPFYKVKRSRRKRFVLIGIGILLFSATAYVIPRLPIVTGYVAKEVCSCIFVAERDLTRTIAEDVGYFPINWADFEIDYEAKTVSSNLFFLGRSIAVYRKDLGCTLVQGVEAAEIRAQQFSRPIIPSDTMLPFPYGDFVAKTRPEAIDAALLDSALVFAMQSKGTRAALVLYDGQLIAEQYAEGFDKNSKHLGWSISKSVTNALYGVMLKKGIATPEQETHLAIWEDERAAITIGDLLQMNSGLEWNEDYFDISEVTKMLFKNDDMGEFAATTPAEHAPKTEWKYSSGSTNILAEVMEKRIGNQKAYWAFPYMELFNPLGMQSVLLEADASGTFVGSSYAWATARDWARFGQLYLNDGVWNEGRIFPKGWVKYSTTPAPNSNGDYGAQIWLNTSGNYLKGCPTDAYNFDGFNGQNITVIPSKKLVVVRLGLDSIETLDYPKFLQKVVAAVRSVRMVKK